MDMHTCSSTALGRQHFDRSGRTTLDTEIAAFHFCLVLVVVVVSFVVDWFPGGHFYAIAGFSLVGTKAAAMFFTAITARARWSCFVVLLLCAAVALWQLLAALVIVVAL